MYRLEAEDEKRIEEKEYEIWENWIETEKYKRLCLDKMDFIWELTQKIEKRTHFGGGMLFDLEKKVMEESWFYSPREAFLFGFQAQKSRISLKEGYFNFLAETKERIEACGILQEQEKLRKELTMLAGKKLMEEYWLILQELYGQEKENLLYYFMEGYQKAMKRKQSMDDKSSYDRKETIEKRHNYKIC